MNEDHARIEGAEEVASAPIVLRPNQPRARPYLGGAGIARLRGIDHDDPHTPEDFVASTTEVHGGGGVGLTILPNGRTLLECVQTDPIGFLGSDHVDRYGASTMLLVKLLDTGERLFVHYHPDDASAERLLGASCGKTEAWIVVAVDDARAAETQGGCAWYGFSESVSLDDLRSWYENQDSAAALAAMRRVPLGVGDTLLVPAGVPHAIGPGLTLVELQQPADLSLLLEYEGFSGVEPANALLGLEPEVAFAAMRRFGPGPAEIEVCRSNRGPVDSAVSRLFPVAADEFFVAWRIHSGSGVSVPPAFRILVVTEGEGELVVGSRATALLRGMTVLVPFAVGEVVIRGDVVVILCAPPSAANIRPVAIDIETPK